MKKLFLILVLWVLAAAMAVKAGAPPLVMDSLILKTNANSTPINVPPYSGTFTNWVVYDYGGVIYASATNNGAGTLTTVVLGSGAGTGGSFDVSGAAHDATNLLWQKVIAFPQVNLAVTNTEPNVTLTNANLFNPSLLNSNPATMGPVNFTNGASWTLNAPNVGDGIGLNIFGDISLANGNYRYWGDARGVTNLGNLGDSFTGGGAPLFSGPGAGLMTNFVAAEMGTIAQSMTPDTMLNKMNMAGTSIGGPSIWGLRLQGSGIAAVNVYYVTNAANGWFTNGDGSAVVYNAGTGFSVVDTNGVATGFQLQGQIYGGVYNAAVPWSDNAALTTLTPPESSWFDNIDGTGIVFSNTLVNSALNVANLGHFLVLTNGYTGMTNWVFDTVNPLQDCLNYAVNSPLNNPQLYPFGNGNYAILQATTNWVGTGIEIGSGVFYQPHGYVVSNQFAMENWHIYGQGWTTFLVGDSNVIQMQTNPFVQSDGPSIIKFELDNVVIACSNIASKAEAVDAAGSWQECSVHDCQFNWWGNLIYTNYSGLAGFGFAPSPVPPGIVFLNFAGGTGHNVAYNDEFCDGAVGIAMPFEHAYAHNCEFIGIGNWSGGSTNAYVTNSSTVRISGDERPLLESDLALGPAIAIAGDGDHILRDDKAYASRVGIYCKGGGNLYGPDILENFHFESVTYPVVDADNSDAATFIDQIQMRDCPYQGLAFPKSYSFNTANWNVSLLAGMDAGISHVWYRALEQHGSMTNYDDVERVDNVPVMVFSAASGQFWVTNKMVFTTNGVAP